MIYPAPERWADQSLRIGLREGDRTSLANVYALDVIIRLCLGYSECVLGYARAFLGRATEGIELIGKGISRLREIGPSSSNISRFTACLGEAQRRAGALLEARETFEQALQMHPDELAWRPETFRLRGELWLEQGRTEQAEGDFRESIALARTMGAKAWELRTTMSLARLLYRGGRCEEARAMLAEIYGWFTEGFDTVDLKEAKGLLEELGDTRAPPRR